MRYGIQSVLTGLTDITMLDSTIEACDAFLATGSAGDIDIRRSTIDYAGTGIEVDARVEDPTLGTNLRVSSTLIKNENRTPPSSSTYGIRLYSDPTIDTETVSIVADIRDSTIITPTAVRAIQKQGARFSKVFTDAIWPRYRSLKRRACVRSSAAVTRVPG